MRTISNDSHSEEPLELFEILEFISGKQSVSNARRLRSAIFSRHHENIVNVEEEENAVVICKQTRLLFNLPQAQCLEKIGKFLLPQPWRSAQPVQGPEQLDALPGLGETVWKFAVDVLVKQAI